MRIQAGPMRGSPVSQDWRKTLSSEKSRAYVDCLHTLETSYAMFSVSLDEAVGLRRRGRLAMANEVLHVAPALCRRLTIPLHSLMCAMIEHAKHFGTAPNILPLNPENFQSTRSQRAARFNDLFSRVLLTRKSQFLHQMTALCELVDELDISFRATTGELCDDQTVQPERDWELLDAVHYDLNTCLRQAVVLFKSFLHALPEAQLSRFEARLRALSAETTSTSPRRVRNLAHRRMAFLKGQ